MPTPWTTRIWQEYRAGNLSRAHRDVLLTLHIPRHRRPVLAHTRHLGYRAGCCVRTVQRALQIAQRLGLVDWCERRVRAAWRWLRTSNLYRFMVPAEPATSSRASYFLPSLPLSARVSVSGRSAALAAMVQEAAGLPDLLALRRAAMAKVIA